MSRQRWRGVLFVGALAFALLAGCARKKERTRDDDREQIKAMLATLIDGATHRRLETLENVVGLSFDGGAFLNVVWFGESAGELSLRDVRLRISPDEARVVLHSTLTRSDSTQARKFIGLDLVYRDERWKFTAFQDAGAHPEM